ncbi:c-type cytochrome [Alkalicoccobacillus murimartini]|uniref:Mono/diheme cytochrome c family protein n=1 Tax=Alkalicoccobacillus murimartini TaxID=171685 RepID=A0ABT9YJB0_9BACI|nr:cytochrome c [Alkalicoccobacillus murimartini]MDQ0207570.1 mono/diheme cytochrome c family protein [Alkalicoccobacillus murimartini]
MTFRLSIMMVLLLFLAACGSAPELDSTITEQDPIETDLDINVDAAQETYATSCIRCHGGDLSGASGPSLIDNPFTPEEIKEIIENGQGTMPPISLSDDDKENLANWLSTQ